MPARFDPKVHHRKSIRLPGYDYSQAGAYFVTIVAQGRESFFGEIIDGEMILNDAGKMVVAIWESMAERFPKIELGAFVVMPNHFHAIVIIRDAIVGAGLSAQNGYVPALNEVPNPNGVATTKRATTRVAPTRDDPTLGQIIGAFKSITTHEYITGVDEKGWARFYKRLWQRNYYEHIIRNERDMQSKWDYILDNPARWEDDEENPKSAQS